MVRTLNVLWVLCFIFCVGQNVQAQQAVPTIYNFMMKTIDGKDQSLADFKGKTLLIVNAASRCRYTPQYYSRETLYKQYKDQGFVVARFDSKIDPLDLGVVTQIGKFLPAK